MPTVKARGGGGRYYATIRVLLLYSICSREQVDGYSSAIPASVTFLPEVNAASAVEKGKQQPTALLAWPKQECD
jgi:hypothetical protein